LQSRSRSHSITLTVTVTVPILLHTFPAPRLFSDLEVHPYPACLPKPSKVSLGTDVSAKRLSVLRHWYLFTYPCHPHASHHCAYLRVLTTVDA
jgi:hypothetical protein